MLVLAWQHAQLQPQYLPIGLPSVTMLARRVVVRIVGCSNSISCTYSNRRLTLNDTSGLKVGDKVYVCYEVTGAEANRLNLPATRVAGSVKLAVNGTHACDEDELAINNDAIILNRSCAQQQNLSAGDKLKATFKQVNPLQEFTVQEPQRSSSTYSKEEWKVFINDVETQAFQRNNRTLTLTGSVPPDSKVKVELHFVP